MAAAFPNTLKVVEAEILMESSGREFVQFEKVDNVFRGVSITQIVALAYILIFQLVVPFILGDEFNDVIGCQALLNIFYTIGLFFGIFVNLFPTNTGIACYMGLQGLIAFIATHKFLTEFDFDEYSFGKGTDLDYSRAALMLWTSLAINNLIVMATSILLLLKYIFYTCPCKPEFGDIETV